MTLLWLLATISQAGGFPRQVEVDNVDAWPTSGRIILEGIYTAMSEGGPDGYRVMHLLKPKSVPFNVPRSLLRENAYPAGNIEVTGVVEMERGKRVVQVENYKLLPSDEHRFKEKMEAAGENPKKLYETADWAKRRFELYNQASMDAAAKQALDAGLALERKQAAGDPEKLAALKTALRQNEGRGGRRDYDFDALDHEIVRAEYARVPEDARALLDFAAAVHERLDGAKQPGDAIDPRYRRDYDAKPLATYDNADPALRRALQRYFYSRIIERALKTSNEKGVAAPFDLAQTAKKLVPEYRDVARRWFRDWAKTQEGRLADLDADAAGEVARTMETELQSFADATKLRAEWLDLRETKLRQREREAREEAGGKALVQRDADGWFDLAARHLAWFPKDPDHEAKAVKILRDVLSFAPQYSKAEIEMRRLGYVQEVRGDWHRKDEAPDVKRTTGVRALAVNMTPTDVLAALGRPTHQARVATAAGPSVVWIYQASGRETLVVFTGPPDALRVSRIRAPGD